MISENNKTKHNYAEHNHSHSTSDLSGKKIFWVIVLNAVITIVEILGGIFSGSLALLSDSIHNLSDTMAIALSYFANKISKKPKNITKTFGYKRAEIIAAFVNASVLFIISLRLIFEAYKRLKNPQTIDGNLMLTVAVVGLIANFISVYLLEKDSHDNMNIKSSYLHLINDTISSVGVILGGVAIKLWGIIWIDPLITVIISIYIIKETWNILRNSIEILMQGSPNLDYDGIKKDIEKIEGINNIHHVHSWMTDEKTIYFEAHIDVDDIKLSEVEKVYDKLEYILKEYYGISHITIQPEVDKCQCKKMF